MKKLSTLARIMIFQQFISEARKILRSLPNCEAKKLCEQSINSLFRTSFKLNEDLICDICQAEVLSDELAFNGKQVRHTKCATLQYSSFKQETPEVPFSELDYIPSPDKYPTTSIFVPSELKDKGFIVYFYEVRR